MSAETVESLPGLTEANAELDRLIAADAAGDQTAGAAAGESAPAGQRAAQATEVESVPGQTKAETETPAAADQSKVQSPESKVEGKGVPKPGEKPAEKSAEKAAGEPSRFAKNQERLQGSWATLNAAKDVLKKERETLSQERADFDRQRAEAEQQFQPEQYEAAAKNFEAQGKFDLAELARKKAEELRKNPPKPGEQAKAAQARQEAQRKEWALKAGSDFPELAKDNSPLQQRVAQLFQEEPDLKVHPKGIYVAARIAHLEAAAASVPAKDKELAELRARVKGFEELTAPGGQTAATRLAGERSFEQKSDEEQFADLQRQAQEMGSLV